MDIREIEVKQNYELKNMTTFKIGGCADFVYFPKTQQEFLLLLKELEEPIILGSCSNILISSNGIKNSVISTTKMTDFTIQGTKITADCGVKGGILAQKAKELGLSGFEFMIGFPGSIGGNIFMNAGAHGQCIADTIISVCVFDKINKEIKIINKDNLNFGYRKSIIQDGQYIVLSAEFELKKTEKENIENLMTRNIEFRKNIQPSLKNPNCGSVFKNPENDSAGRLLEKAGAKNFKVNDAQVWQKHANFIVNNGNATSEDVCELMYKMHQTVKEKYTIKLEPEVRFVGVKTQREEEILCTLTKK